MNKKNNLFVNRHGNKFGDVSALAGYINDRVSNYYETNANFDIFYFNDDF